MRRKTLVVLVCTAAAAAQHRADGLSLSAFVSTYCSVCAHSSRSAAAAAPRRSSRTFLRADLSEDDYYSRLMRRMARLERTVRDQDAEVEEMRSSMEHMRMIVQIQAQIDSCLVDEDGLLLSSSLAEDGDVGGEPHPRLVKQAIRLLRVRQRVLQAWEFDGEQENDSSSPPLSPRADNSSADYTNDNSNSSRRIARRSDDTARRRTRERARDRRRFSDFDEEDAREFFESGTYGDPSIPMPMPTQTIGGAGGRDGSSSRRGSSASSSRNTGVFEPRLEQRRPPKTNQDAADAAGAGIVAALMEGRRRLIVEVDDAQLRYNSPDFCHEAMAEFVELLTLPLTTALENLKARQNLCKIVIQGAHQVDQVKEAMVLDVPDSLQVVSLEKGRVTEADRVVALVSPENWKGKNGKHLRRVLAEAHDAAIILINPTDPDKFLRPADYNAFESVYHLSPMRVNYLQPLPPPHHPPAAEHDLVRIEAGRGGGAGGFEEQAERTGEALLLERLSESVWAEEKALEAAAAAAAEAAATAVPGDGIDDTANPSAGVDGASNTSAEGGLLFDGAAGVGAAAAAERALARASLEFGAAATTSSGMEWDEREDESMLDEAAAAATMAAWGEELRGEEAADGGLTGRKEPRWGEGGVGEGNRGADEAMEMSALAVTLRQYPDAWEAFVDLHDGMGFRLCGTWDLEPPQTAVRTVVMDHILRIVMD
eukprot:g14493.t1